MTGAPLIELNNGVQMPALGLGTASKRGDEARAATATALDLGYRMIDTASRYENEEPIGQAVRESGLDRGEIFVVSKVRGSDHGYDETMLALDGTLGRLGLAYLDLYLIHWPLPRIDRYVETWRAMIEQLREGRVRAIGVSNFLPEHLDRLAAESDVVPAVNQVELHPLLPQVELRAADAERGIVTQAWSPLARGGALDSAVLADIAEEHDRTVAQIVLRWHVENGVVPIPRSGDPGRQRENLDVFSFALTDDDHARIDALDDGHRVFGIEPLTHEEF